MTQRLPCFLFKTGYEAPKLSAKATQPYNAAPAPQPALEALEAAHNNNIKTLNDRNKIVETE